MPVPASYVHGASEIPLLAQTVGSCFDETATRFAERQALIVPYQNVHWTWARLKQEVDAFAAGLLALGFEPIVALVEWLPVIGWVAPARWAALGALFVPLAASGALRSLPRPASGSVVAATV